MLGVLIAGLIVAGAPVPVVPDGFRVELIAEAPEILWPSAVLALPDGSLLVAEDPMDMPGPTHEPLDRILRLVLRDDGTIAERTVFASGLNAVFGLEWIDGSVYVMNMPFLTVLRDADGDGVAEERRNLLTTLGRVAPGWPGGFNDHIVTGIRLGMDGFLYVSVGDKGVPLAIGTDGSRISLRGGGVVRLDPDGGSLEVVASGTRNHLDVAMDERDRIFTYDNTDDGLGWWTRFSHILPGGYYGYPWDYHDHPERFVPALAEYGGGSPCGGLVYRGDAWPEPYRGSVFFCEWGQGLVRRFEVERSGAGFRVTRHEDFMTSGGGAFRPLDACVSRDGRFLYVADWNYGGWTAPEKTGRLFRVRRTFDEPGAPAPGDPVDALEHPSFDARLDAQRALARAGRASIAPLRAVLESASSSDAARRHAVWALSLVGGKPLAPRRHETPVGAPFETDAEASEVLVAALRHESADTRAEAARALGVRGRVPVGELLPLLSDPDSMVRREAAISVGRAGAERIGAAATDALLVALGSALDDPFLRFAIRRAIERAGDAGALAAALPTLRDDVRREALLAVRERYELPLVRAMAKLACGGAADPAARAEVVAVLAEAHRQRETWDGTWWQIQPAKGKWPPKTVEWAGTAAVLDGVRAALGDPSARVRDAAVAAAAGTGDRDLAPAVRGAFDRAETQAARVAVLRALAALRDEGAAPLLARVVRDPGLDADVRREAADAAAAIGGGAMRDILIAIVLDDATPDEYTIAPLRALARMKAAEAAPAAERRLASPAPAARAAAAETLAAVAGADAAPALRGLMLDADGSVRVAAVRALASLALPDETASFLPLVADEAAGHEAILALARVPTPLALDAYLRGVVEKNVAVRDASRTALRSIREAARPRIEALHAASLLAPAALEAVRALFSEPAPVRRWRVLGPFPSRERVPDLAAAGAIDFECRYETADGSEVAWRDVEARASDGFVDLIAALADRANVVAFACADVESPRERTALVTTGSDDSIAVWVDGEKVHEHADDRGFTPDQDRFEVKLRAGSNRFLVRIGQTGGFWAFAAKVASEGTGPLFDGAPSAAGADPIAALRARALGSPGDRARGRAIFADPKGVGCIKCHRVGGEGAIVGPELTFIGSKYSRDELVTSILEPSRTMYDEYRATVLVLADERVLVGQVRETRDDAIVLVDSGGEARVVPLAEIAERHVSDRSSMPEGVAAALRPDEFADLVAYLESLVNPAPSSGGGR